MEYTEYQDPELFLSTTRLVFEESEALYGLMLGVSLHLASNPFHYGARPYLATIASARKIELIAVMTPPYKLQIASLNKKPARFIELLAVKLQAGCWAVPAVIAEEEVAKLFESEWNKLTAGQSVHGMRQRIYKLCAVKYNYFPSGRFRQATIEDLNYAAKWANSFNDDCFGPSSSDEGPKIARYMIENKNLYLWEDPLPVSMGAFVRPTTRGVSISFVYTPPEFRKKGYASAVVASLSKLALESGKDFCSLYTDLNNPVSNNIYQKIGYDAVADVIDVNFTCVSKSERRL